jgi:hypothetical protein
MHNSRDGKDERRGHSLLQEFWRAARPFVSLFNADLTFSTIFFKKDI